MKILLLGANGMLGSDLQKVAKDPFYQSITLIPWTRAECDVEHLESIDSALASIKFDVLLNCTSYHKTDEVEKNADRGVRVNAQAVRCMAEHCQRRKARFFHISTDYVFGGQEKREPLTEEDLALPVNVYGATKLLGESLARLSCEDTVIFRVASLFGKQNATGKGGNFVLTMLRLANERPEISVVEDQIMSPTGTIDLAHMILTFLLKAGPSGVYHAVNTGSTSWYEFASTIMEKAQLKTVIKPIPSSQFPLPAMRPSYSALSNKKLEWIIGTIPSWQDALKRSLI